MRYMELIADDGTVVGVAEVETPCFVRYVERHDSFIGCKENDAQAVIVGDHICCLTGHEDIKSVKDDIVLNAIFIDKDEYDRLEYLDNLEPSPDEPEDDEPVEPEDDTKLDIKVELIRLRTEVNDLKRANSEKDERIEFLEDCLLEMSEVVYDDN